MKKIYLSLLAIFFSMLLFSTLALADEHKTLPVGSKAPDFKLPGIDGKMYSLASFKNSTILVIVFTCNHCPTAQAYEERLIKLTSAYAAKGVAFVAVMPNDPKSVQLNELGYADLGDSFKEMKLHAKRKKFNFPYLFDGENEKMSKAYGPIATPHVFIFNKDRTLCYSGRIDDVEKPSGQPKSFDTKNALDELLDNKIVTTKTTKVFGCSVKWAEKEDLVSKAQNEWAAMPVMLDTIDENRIKDLIKNSSDKLRLINVWATWCGPCVNEFPDFVTINRMYRKRDFEFISISADNPQKKEMVLKALKNMTASNTNYLFSKDDKYKLIEAVDSNWTGALPYTILIEPGGEIIYAKQGTINPMEMKTLIVENKFIGRFY